MRYSLLHQNTISHCLYCHGEAVMTLYQRQFRCRMKVIPLCTPLCIAILHVERVSLRFRSQALCCIHHHTSTIPHAHRCSRLLFIQSMSLCVYHLCRHSYPFMLEMVEARWCLVCKPHSILNLWNCGLKMRSTRMGKRASK